jgi:riboflavin kinase/FMN adenylyltransferase
MRTYVGLEALPIEEDRGTVITIGTFDGVHLGHRMLIAKAIADARASDLDACVVTWDRHPAVTLRPDKAPPALSSPERKIELIGELDPDLLVVLPFDTELSTMEAEDFAGGVLGKGLHARKVIVGQGWRFGRKARGDTDLLSEVMAARELLGRPFDLDGVVTHGDARGKDLGIPTANVHPDPSLVRPPRGVYAGRARVEDVWYTAAINVGVNPTFGGDESTTPVRVETHILDFDADLYGRTLRVEFWQRLRDELRFDSAEALVDQIQKDITQTREIVTP